ncbi:MAG: outer membrane beta-barrel protein [Pseudomonadota bacterium]
MKSIIAYAAASAAALSFAHAGDTYIQLHAGAFQQTSDNIEFGGEDFLGNVIDVDVDTDADTGFAIGGLLGYYILPAIALEGEMTYRSANVDDVSVLGVSESIDEDINTLAFMVNGVFRPSLPLLPEPYVGVGIGYITSNLDDVDGDSATGAFAYQVKAGVSFDILPTPGKIGLEVAYLATTDFDAGGGGIDADYEYAGLTGLITYRKNF